MKFPRLEANFALTIDGKVATKKRGPTNFTSARDKRRMQEIRAKVDAVIVARTTLQTDNMSLRLSSTGLRKQREGEGRHPEPLRVIFSNRGKLRKTWRVFMSRGAPIVVFTTRAMPNATRVWLENIADVQVEPRGRSVNIRNAMEILARNYGVRSAVCEGGPTLLRAFLDEGMLNRLNITFAPVIFGGAEAPTLFGPAGTALLRRSVPLKLENFETHGGEGFAVYSVKNSKKFASGR